MPVPDGVGVGVDDVERVGELGGGAGFEGRFEFADAALVELQREPVPAAVTRAVHARVVDAPAAHERVQGRRDIRFKDVRDGRQLVGVDGVDRQRLLALGVARLAGHRHEARVGHAVAVDGERARGESEEEEREGQCSNMAFHIAGETYIIFCS